MARYEHLPIYKAALDAAVHFEQVVAGFSRYHKYSLGTRQYRHFRQRFSGDVLFFQVGRFMEFYQPGDVLIARELGLTGMTANRRGARFGFPVAQTGHHLLTLLRAGPQ